MTVPPPSPDRPVQASTAGSGPVEPVEQAPASGIVATPQEGPRATLTALRRQGVLGSLDLYFALTLGDLVNESRVSVLLASALTSRYVTEGHVCLALPRLAGTELRARDGSPTPVSCPPLESWRSELLSSPLVGGGTERTPLVLDSASRLYLRRYWQHEQRVAYLLAQRAANPPVDLHDATLRNSLTQLFGAQPGWDGQRVAAQLAVVGRLTIISGGPGTGKTSTVVKLLALLVENALALGLSAPRTLLLAPTGKAAARLVESIRKAKSRLGCASQVKDSILEEASTIHRALGTVAGSRTQFRHNMDNPLPADLVLVDEASMVDLALMRRLLEAVPEHARLILLGDRNQLTSVEAGSVLGDLAFGLTSPHYSRRVNARVQSAFGCALPQVPSSTPLLDRVLLPQTRGDSAESGCGRNDNSSSHHPLMDCMIELTESHRFGPNSGIGGLARAIEHGSPESALARLRSSKFSDVGLVSQVPGSGLGASLEHAVLEGYRTYLQEKAPIRALTALDRFRLLCAHREGSAGVEGLNPLIESVLSRAGLIRPHGHFYAGRPIIITENDYQVSLFNGDIGLVLPDGAAGLRVHFADTDGTTRSVAPSRLPQHETVFAMSVHKSQGSEFDEIALVLPSEGSPLLTRELLYTAITRARRKVVLYGTEQAVRVAIQRRVERASGLQDALLHWASGSLR